MMVVLFFFLVLGSITIYIRS